MINKEQKEQNTRRDSIVGNVSPAQKGVFFLFVVLNSRKINFNILEIQRILSLSQKLNSDEHVELSKWTLPTFENSVKYSFQNIFIFY